VVTVADPNAQRTAQRRAGAKNQIASHVILVNKTDLVSADELRDVEGASAPSTRCQGTSDERAQIRSPSRPQGFDLTVSRHRAGIS